MNNNNISELQRDSLIQELIELVIEKAKKDSKKTKRYGLSIYLEGIINIDRRTIIRYYNGYILNRKKDRKTPYDYNLDVLCSYINLENFDAFGVNSESKIEKGILKKEIRKIEKKLYNVKRVGLISSMILLMISTLFILKYYKKNCMIWVDDHYEKIRCTGLENEKKLDKVVLKNFTKVDVCKDSSFFENDDFQSAEVKKVGDNLYRARLKVV